MRQFVETALLFFLTWMLIFPAAQTAGTTETEPNSCTLDDLVVNHILPSERYLPIEAPCKADATFTLVQVSAAGLLVNFSSLQNNLSVPPLCLGFTVDVHPENTHPFLIFYNSRLEELGTLTPTRNNVIITVQESTAAFTNLSAVGFNQWQFCFKGSEVELYQGCRLVGSQPFSSSVWEGVSHIAILRTPFSETAPTFMNAVSQLYLLSCSGSGIETQAMIDLQCRANPSLNCSDNNVALPISNVTENYITELNNNTKNQPTPSPCPTVAVTSADVTTNDVTITIYPSTCPSSSDIDCSQHRDEVKRLRGAIIALSILCVVLAGGLVLHIILVCMLKKSKVVTFKR